MLLEDYPKPIRSKEQLEEVAFALLGTMEDGTYGYYAIQGREKAAIYGVKRVLLVVVLEAKKSHPIFGHGPILADVQEENWLVLNDLRKEGKYKTPPPVYAVDADKFYIE